MRAKPRILVVYGTRPEAIKLAPVIGALRDDSRHDCIVVSSGQHREMILPVEEWFGIEPDFRLGVMKDNQGLNSMVAKLLADFNDIFKTEKPDFVMVQGDTSTALAGALAAFHLQIPVAHLEAGLRTGDLSSPFPEEGNRKLIGQISSLHLAPTPSARENLLKEGIPAGLINTVGNTVIDALQQTFHRFGVIEDPWLSELVESGKRIVLVTTHRRENLNFMVGIALALRELAERYLDTEFVLPLHLNPAVRQQIVPVLQGLPNVRICNPLDYPTFVALMKNSYLVLTDSGGVQEEAPSFGKPVLVMRNTSERGEGISQGLVKLVGTSSENIVAEVSRLLESHEYYGSVSSSKNPYGDGKASLRTVAAISAYLGTGVAMPDFAPNS
ncbi:non-hydrolyzing UDP-N-acetylglucosamine 2-epimerase [Corynebacterium haemomassiliense]|uniref:UDP-N-acetylglucosamine 2-epimerase (non-hydrolyzing) n=1 Tax=Corynebacterium haemomassiliense TaxID=2754726 RepID=A0A7W2EAQ5_9CORY|nr:UDP-N-acetylglucosamine 2-epimerase (non-hydrolyzing) [Corynebacterium haemomassiliense]MBA5244193.1 UDP-N-acetylglucosamine 2-epimerase (non-hydrolyzing) [Corynebacterium haemomassiliense]